MSVPKRGRSSPLGYGGSLCAALVLLVLLSRGRWAVTSATAPKTASQPGDNPQLDEKTPRIPSQYWKSPAGLADETPQQLREKEKLLRLIERVQAIRLNRKRQTPSPPTEVTDVKDASKAPEPNGVSSSDPNQTQSEIRSSPVPGPSAPRPTPPPMRPAVEPNDTVKNTLAHLEALSGHADEMDRPFEMAELLRESGFLQEAASYYRVALKRMKQDDPAVKRRRAWAIFQAGSCVRHGDPAEAGRMFQQLLTEHPDSIWKETAEIWLALVDWYATEKPWELIESLQQVNDPTETAHD